MFKQSALIKVIVVYTCICFLWVGLCRSIRSKTWCVSVVNLLQMN